MLCKFVIVLYFIEYVRIEYEHENNSHGYFEFTVLDTSVTPRLPWKSPTSNAKSRVESKAISLPKFLWESPSVIDLMNPSSLLSPQLPISMVLPPARSNWPPSTVNHTLLWSPMSSTQLSTTREVKWLLSALLMPRPLTKIMKIFSVSLSALKKYPITGKRRRPMRDGPDTCPDSETLELLPNSDPTEDQMPSILTASWSWTLMSPNLRPLLFWLLLSVVLDHWTKDLTLTFLHLHPPHLPPLNLIPPTVLILPAKKTNNKTIVKLANKTNNALPPLHLPPLRPTRIPTPTKTLKKFSKVSSRFAVSMYIHNVILWIVPKMSKSFYIVLNRGKYHCFGCCDQEARNPPCLP